MAGPASEGLRPTSDSLRETLFNMLGPSVEGARVLDGYAGTGALGLEALSRGASHVTFIERDGRAIRVLRENVTRCRAENACVIIREDFLGVSAATRQFDLVLLDPPYDVEDLRVVLDAAVPLVAAHGRLVLEHSRRRVPPEAPAGFERGHVRIAGDSALSFYAPKGS